MSSTVAMAEVGALVGDPARANMLGALMDGRALTATELARVAGIAPQTASGHLARLTEAGLLAAERQGRYRYHRLASPAVAQMLKGVMAVATGLDGDRRPGGRKQVVEGPRDRALRLVRTCYDHLAGELAVAIADRLVEQGHIELSTDGGLVTPSGLAFMRKLGVDTEVLETRRQAGRVFCRPCLDWSERRPHIAGAVGASLCSACFSQGWLRRVEGSRAVTVTPAGQIGLSKVFSLRIVR